MTGLHYLCTTIFIEMGEEKQLFIFCGCNGAGKTTASYTMLPEVLHCKEFVNADEIAKGLSPFNPERVAIDAGKLMLIRMNELLKNDVTFAFETTLATRTYTRLIERAHENGCLLFPLRGKGEHLLLAVLSESDKPFLNQPLHDRVDRGLRDHELCRELVLGVLLAVIQGIEQVHLVFPHAGFPCGIVVCPIDAACV